MILAIMMGVGFRLGCALSSGVDEFTDDAVVAMSLRDPGYQ